ncbi:MAG: carboxypeptidase regulatory-like domain-containing protein [Candidatus Marsarchaeota archaeon]|nr:carboxypeptidase regulatory-like domain-containing protein [Candidatus Marsarchaeota archaeon]
MHKYTAFAILGFLALTVYGLGFNNNQGFNIQNNPTAANVQANSSTTTSQNFNINNPSIVQNSNTQTVQNNANTQQNSLNPESFNINNPSLSIGGVKTSLSTDSFATGTCVTNSPQLPGIVKNVFNQICSLGGNSNPFKDFCNALNSMNQPLTPPSQCASIGAPVFNQSCSTTVNLPYSVCRSFWNSGWQATWYGPCPSCPAGYTRDSCDSSWWDFAISSKTYCHKDTTVVGQCPSGQSVVSTYTQATTLNGAQDACDTTMIISNVNVIVNALAGTASITWVDSVYGNATVSFSGPVSGSQSTPFVQAYNHNIVLTGLTNGNYNFNIQSCNGVSGCGGYNGIFNVNDLISFLQIESPSNNSYAFNTPLFLNFTVNGSVSSYNASYVITGLNAIQMNAVNGFNSVQLSNLNVGAYVLNLIVSAGIQSANQSVQFSVINSTPNVSLTASSWNVVYGNSSNVSCSSSDNGTIQLFDNGVAVSNPDVETLGAGVYNYTCSFNGYGYNPLNVSALLTVTPAQSTTQVLLNNSNADDAIIYGDSITANYSVNVGGLNTVFYLNGTIIPDNYNTSGLSAGFYNFTALTDGGVNYSNSSDSKFLTVNPASAQTLVFLNGSNTNDSIVYGESIIANYNTSGNFNTSFYLNGSLISNDFNTSGLSAGFYNFTAIVSGGQNYSSSVDSKFLTIQQATSNINLNLNGINGDINVLQNSIVNVSIYSNFNDIITTTISNLSGVVYNSTSTSFNYTVTSGSYYTVTSAFAGDINYTPSSSTHTIVISGLNFSNLAEYSTPSGQQYSGLGEVFNCNYTDSYGNEIPNASVEVVIGNASYPTTFGSNYFYSANLSAGNYSWYCNASSVYYQPQVGAVENFTVLQEYPNASYSYINASNTTVGIPSSVVVFVADSLGNPLSNVSVSLTSNRNDSINPLSEISVNGFANFTVNSTVAGASNLTAVISGFNLSTVVFFNPGVLSEIIISPSNASIPVNSTQQFNATGFDVYNNTVNSSFNWSVSNSSVGFIDSNGLFTSSTTAGSANVTTSSNGVNGSAFVMVTSGVPSTLIISASLQNLTVGADSNISAVVLDAYGNVINNGTIYFNTSLGVFSSSNSANASDSINVNGIAVDSLNSTVAGTAVVYAQFGGLLNSTTISFNAGQPALLNVSMPGNVSAGQNATVNSTVTDAFGNPVYVNVSFSSTLGSFNPALVETINGSAQSTFESNTAGLANITISAGNLSYNGSINVVPGNTASLIISAPSIMTAGSADYVNFSVTDAFGNPINGTLNVSINNSTQGIQVLNGFGQVSFSENTSGTYSINATINNISNSTVINVVAANPSVLNISANPIQVSVGGNSTITVVLTDAFGNPVSNATIDFYSTSNLSSNLSVTNLNGSASINLTANAGVNNILASYAYSNSSVNNSISVNGVIPNYNVSIYVEDQGNNPIQNASVSISGVGVFTTNSNGTIDVQLTGGAYSITAYENGFIGSEQNLTVNSNAQLIFILQKAGDLNGFVNSTNGTPLNALITAGNYSTNSANGVFSISNIIPGIYNVTGSASGFANNTLFNIPVYAGNTTYISMILAPLGGVNGTVVDALNGSSIAGANVTITQNGVLIYDTLTNSLGVYSVSGIAAGYYNVTVTATGYGSTARDNVIVSQGSVSTINFAM